MMNYKLWNKYSRHKFIFTLFSFRGFKAYNHSTLQRAIRPDSQSLFKLPPTGVVIQIMVVSYCKAQCSLCLYKFTASAAQCARRGYRKIHFDDYKATEHRYV